MEISHDTEQETNSSSSSSWFAVSGSKLRFPFAKLFSRRSSPENRRATGEKQRVHGGWKTMPFVLGNETLERLASIGLASNFMVFLLTQFHLDQVMASNVLSIWSGVANFTPLIGAYISDSYLGRFRTIAIASIASFMGMVTLTLIPWIPQLHPPHCKSNHCIEPNVSQFTVLAVALGLLSIGTAGIRPCSIPFGVDQFDSSTEEGRRGINSFFNWYYTTFTVVLILAVTLVVYIQDSVSWVLGFGIPTILMMISIVLFFSGARYYIHVAPQGSVFSGIAQVFVASYKKRKIQIQIQLEDEGDKDDAEYYDPPLKMTGAKKLTLTRKFSFLNRAAVIMENEVLPDGTNANPWRLCSIQAVEETKCLLNIIPIWASGIIAFTAMAQQNTFTLSQALKMDRRLGPHFNVPAGTLSVISMITIGIFLPIYDRIIVPYTRKYTRVEGGITLLQRMGIGLIFSTLSMIVAGFFERERRASAVNHGSPTGIAPISVFWLSPQLILLGLADAFNIIGQIEFYNKEFPENMSSLANSLLSCTMAGANYLSALLVNIVHNTTGNHGHPDWLTKDINQGRVENLYFMISGLGVLNLGYFVWVAKSYNYKSRYLVDEDENQSVIHV